MFMRFMNFFLREVEFCCCSGNYEWDYLGFGLYYLNRDFGGECGVLM